MIARISAALAMAALVTASLLFAMQALVTGGKDVLTESGHVRLTEFVRVERNEKPEEHWSKPSRPPMPAMRPGTVPLTDTPGAPVPLAAAVTAPRFRIGAQPSTGIAAVGDSDYLPTVKVAPVYPSLAVARNLQGHVLIEFTVTTTGHVRDITVLESSAPLLEASAIKAALGFEYKPRVIGGEPVEVTGVQNRIVFMLEEPQQIAMQL